jgi:hypothetical protein
LKNNPVFYLINRAKQTVERLNNLGSNDDNENNKDSNENSGSSNSEEDSSNEDTINYTELKKQFQITVSANRIVKDLRSNRKARVIKCQDVEKTKEFNLDYYIERYADFICSLNENTAYLELDSFIEGEKLLFNNI